jgi:hypothetical protein
MKRLILVLVVLLVTASAVAAERVTKVPQAFIGRWCNADSESLLEIKSNEISYYESQGPIKAVVASGDGEVALILELTGEGETWLTTAQFKLSKDKKQLIDAKSEPPYVRRRCSR